jgi:hypothetical protein
MTMNLNYGYKDIMSPILTKMWTYYEELRLVIITRDAV